MTHMWLQVGYKGEARAINSQLSNRPTNNQQQPTNQSFVYNGHTRTPWSPSFPSQSPSQANDSAQELWPLKRVPSQKTYQKICRVQGTSFSHAIHKMCFVHSHGSQAALTNPNSTNRGRGHAKHELHMPGQSTHIPLSKRIERTLGIHQTSRFSRKPAARRRL